MLYENEQYQFREQYQVSQGFASFFQEDTPALQRLSQDFARTLVSNILEASSAFVRSDGAFCRRSHGG